MASYIFEPPPSPFFTKLPPGTPINWADPCSSGLVLCYPLNEQCGQSINDVAQGDTNTFTFRWGLDTVVGTGAGVPFWTTFEDTVALRTFGGADYQNILPAYTPGGSKIRPFVDMRRGVTLEFWGKSDATDGDGVFYGMMEVLNVGSGEKIRMELAAGLSGAKLPYVRISNTLGLDTDFYASHAALPNHWVASVSARGICDLYANGLLVASGSIGQLSTDANYLYLCNTGNFVTDSQWQGYVYKFSVYNYAMGPAGVQALAQNPMRVLQSTIYPGVFNAHDVIHDPPQVTLLADPTSVRSGTPATLTWTSEFSDTLVLDQGIGSVIVPSGDTLVVPLSTTTYTILATNDFGTASASATITVEARGAGRPTEVSEGAILQRDLTVRSDGALKLAGDDGTAYDAFATMGSIVLVHPSELALVLFFTLESSAIGSHPVVGVLLDEIAATVAVPFADLTAYVPDPPVLVAAQTVYNDRFYISETQQPAVCRHLQVKVTWPQEAAANELLTWSLIGAHVEER